MRKDIDQLVQEYIKNRNLLTDSTIKLILLQNRLIGMLQILIANNICETEGLTTKQAQDQIERLTREYRAELKRLNITLKQ